MSSTQGIVCEPMNMHNNYVCYTCNLWYYKPPYTIWFWKAFLALIFYWDVIELFLNFTSTNELFCIPCMKLWILITLIINFMEGKRIEHGG